MKTKLSILITTILFILLTSCSNTENGLNSIEFTVIGQGNLYGNGQENIAKQNIVISNSNSWNELITKMNSVNNVSDSFTETNIDFQKFTVVAVFDDVKPNGGHSIDIIKIIENENNIAVTYINILKGDLTTVITQPYHIVKIPKINKPIIFK